LIIVTETLCLYEKTLLIFGADVCYIYLTLYIYNIFIMDDD